MINNRFTNFLLAPRYRTARHLFLQFVVFMITVNILWNVPMRPLSFPQRLLGWAIYFISIDAVFYINLYWLFPRFLLKNRLLIYALGVSGVSLIVIIAVAIFQIFTIDISVTYRGKCHIRSISHGIYRSWNVRHTPAPSLDTL